MYHLVRSWREKDEERGEKGGGDGENLWYEGPSGLSGEVEGHGDPHCRIFI